MFWKRLGNAFSLSLVCHCSQVSKDIIGKSFYVATFVAPYQMVHRISLYLSISIVFSLEVMVCRQYTPFLTTYM